MSFSEWYFKTRFPMPVLIVFSYIFLVSEKYSHIYDILALFAVSHDWEKWVFQKSCIFFLDQNSTKGVNTGIRNIPNIEPICIFGQSHRYYSHNLSQESVLLEAYIAGFQGFWCHSEIRGCCGQVFLFIFYIWVMIFHIIYKINNKK